MPALRLTGTACGAVLAILALWGARGDAHKPITSPYTFNEDVAPILRAQCGGCHAPGGVAPMSLLSHGDAVPWGESIRAELMAGHMPPWSVEGPRGRFRNAQALTARELNVLLTWVTGGTPAGDPQKAPEAARANPQWPLGEPDLVLALPQAYTLGAETQEATAEFVIETGSAEPLWVRAVDLLPGTPAIVRSATIRVRSAADASRSEPPAETVLAVWVPGDRPVALEGDAAFLLPARAEIVVSLQYRKTWEYERQEMTDRSTVGIYLAPAPAPPLQALVLAAGAGESRGAASAGPAVPAAETIRYSRTVAQDVRALAIYPDPALDGARVTVTAARPDGSQEELIAFRPAAGWTRRYWFAEPVALPRGTTITVSAQLTEPLLPPGALPAARLADPAAVRLVLDVVRP
jgi:hypothetical protein